MARRGAPKGQAALLRRYGADLAAIRQRYESKAAGLRQEARRLESDYKVLARQFRTDIAKLRRAGVISKATDSRRAAPASSALSRALNDLGDILTGRARAMKVSPQVARKLRDEDVQIARGRAILSPRYTVRKGEVVEKAPRAPGMSGGKVVRRINLTRDYEKQVTALFNTMKADDYIGIDLGNNFSRLFNMDQLEEFLDYLEGGDSFHPRAMKSVAVVRVKTSELRPYYEEMARRALARQRERSAAKASVRASKAAADRAAGRDKARRAAALRKARKGGRGSKNYG